MSLTSLATRLCFVEAIRGQTLAGDNVEDGPLDPVSLAASTASPLIVVYSDAEHFRSDSESFTQASGEDGAHQLVLTADLFLPSALSITPEGGTSVPIDVRDFGAGVAFDLMVHQIEGVLSVGASQWAQLFRSFVMKVTSIQIQAYVLPSQDKNTRYPARNITMTLDVIDSPPFGQPPTLIWQRFIAAVQASDDVADLAPIFESWIEGKTLPSWQQIAAMVGLDPAQAGLIGLGPLPSAGNDLGAAPPTQEVVVERNGPFGEPVIVETVAGTPE